LTPDATVNDVDKRDVVTTALERVAVPTVDEPEAAGGAGR